MKIIILLILLLMSLQDYKTKEVSNLLFVPLLFFIKFKLMVLIFFILFLLLYRYIASYIGGADIKLFLTFSAIFPFKDFIYWLFIASLIALIYLRIRRQKEIRFFPCLWFSYVLVLLI